jgi:hypothetical protein
MARSVEYIRQRYEILTKLLEKEFPEEVDNDEKADTISANQAMTERLNAFRRDKKQAD